VQSGEEKTDNTYSITFSPEDNGFFKMRLKIVKDYGGKDCGDSEENNTQARSKWSTSSFIRPSRCTRLPGSQPRHLLWAAASGDGIMGCGRDSRIVRVRPAPMPKTAIQAFDSIADAEWAAKVMASSEPW
jgi:hypothetical protein